MFGQHGNLRAFRGVFLFLCHLETFIDGYVDPSFYECPLLPSLTSPCGHTMQGAVILRNTDSIQMPVFLRCETK